MGQKRAPLGLNQGNMRKKVVKIMRAWGRFTAIARTDPKSTKKALMK